MTIISSDCPACSYPTSQLFTRNPKDYEGHAIIAKKFNVMRCNSCESIYLNPFPLIDDTKNFYPTDYMAQNKEDKLLSIMDYIWGRKEISRLAKTWGKKSFILDYGSGRGKFVSLMRKEGCQHVYGYEPMDMNKEGNQIFFSDINQIIKSGMKFDYIRMNDTIEHLVNIDETMILLASLLKKDGIVFGQTANASNISSKLMGKYWGFLHFPYHTVIFSPEGLRKSAMRWGFREVETGDSYLPSAWAFTFEHILKDLFRLKKKGHLAIYSLLLLVSIPFVLFEKFLPGHTSEFVFQLKK